MNKLLPMFVLFLTITVIALPVTLVRGCRVTGPPVQSRLDRSKIISPAGEVNIRVSLPTGEDRELPLEEYLVGVVAAEMPASFDVEALKAQAVVARTYTVNQMLSFEGKGCTNHPGADICTDSTHCQAWEPEEASLKKWPEEQAVAYMNKIRQAVRETAGLVATYDGRLIDAVFHSCCGGHTEDSEKVWQAALPYLRGVECQACMDSRWWKTEQVFTGPQFASAILPHVSAVPVSSSGRPLLDSADRSASGRVQTLRVAGESVSGRDFRSALGLPSTHFSWRFDGDRVIFTNYGYGHGVGLCQYGADGLAKTGHTFEQIIRSYYTGVRIQSLSSLHTDA